jgi:PAS domain S-box-containing protein
MGSLILFGVAAETARGIPLPAGEAIEEVGDTQALVARLERGDAVDLLVLGPQVQDPLRTVQRVSVLDRELPVLVLCEPLRYEQLQQALRITPLLGRTVTCTPMANAATLAQQMQRMLGRSRRRRRFDSTTSALNEQMLAMAAPRPHAEQLLDRLLDFAPIGVVTVDAQGNVVACNRAAREMLEREEWEATGLPLGSFFDGAAARDLEALLDTCSRTGQRVEGLVLELAVQQAETRYIEVTAGAIGEQAEQSGCLVLLQDVTARVRYERDRAQAQEEVRFQKALLELQSEASLDGILVVSAEGRIISFNQRFIEMWDIPAEVVHSRSDEAALQVALEQLADPDEFLARVAYLYAHPHLESQEEVHLKDGRVYERYSTPIRGLDVDPQGRVWFFRDVTDRKRQEDVQAFLSRSSSLLASSLDYETTLATVARLAVPVLADWCVVYIQEQDGSIRRLAVEHADPGMSEVAQAIQHGFRINPLAPQGVPEVIRSGKSLLFESVSNGQISSDVDDPEGMAQVSRDIRVVSWICVPLNARERTFGAISLLTAESGRVYGRQDLDLAEEVARRAAQAIDNALLYEEAQEAIRIRDTFFSIASHELRTPITSIKGYSELLERRAAREGTTDEWLMRGVRIINQEADRLNRLADLLLDVSRIQSGRLEIAHEPVDLVALAQQAATRVEPVLERHTLRLIVPPQPVVVLGDELRLDQALHNLLSNAIKYSTDGGQVTLQVECGEDHARLLVSDEGIGIPTDAVPTLFDRFYRAENVLRKGISGLGLGLYIVYHIVEAHGGTVRVRSQEGVGSTFTIELPLAAPATEVAG